MVSEDFVVACGFFCFILRDFFLHIVHMYVYQLVFMVLYVLYKYYRSGRIYSIVES